MSMAHSQNEIKGKSLVELAEQLEAEIREAVREGKSLYVMEKDIFGRALQIGHAAIEQVLALQGDGDLGQSVVTQNGRRLERSEEPAQRPLRTVFGEHTLWAYVYAAKAPPSNRAAPINARLSLPPGRCSYFFEEFSQYFCVDQAFGQASQGLATVLRQEVSVDTLERINRRMGEQAEGFLDRLPTPPAKEEGQLLVFTADGKGVPLVKADAQRVPAFDKAERPGNRRMATLAAVYTIIACIMTNTWRRATRSRPESSRELADTWSRIAWSGAACDGDSPVRSRCFMSEPCINPPTGMTFIKTALAENSVHFIRIAPC